MTQAQHGSFLSLKKSILIFLSAFIIRALIMQLCIAPNQFYKQPDSADYHMGALCIATGHGMHRFDRDEPIFWRTPGYPVCLSFFYKFFGIKSYAFEPNAHAQQALIWFQILISSLIPLLIFALARIMTRNYLIALISAWISVFHPGFVLASVYLLTEGLALFFFYLFLIGLYTLLFSEIKKHAWIIILLSALSLSAYTWMRPMGEFVAIFSTFLLILCMRTTWKKSTINAAAFAFIFFATLAPWYARNHELTGEWFFCPTLGTYLNVFAVPKILRRTTGKPLLECHQIARDKATIETKKKMRFLRGTKKHVSNNVCKLVAYPIIAQHPCYFAYDWIMETVKTTFDLYSYQIVSMANGSYFYDPIEEFLPDKIEACLYKEKMPTYARAVCWIEFIFQIVLWIGIFGGLWMFVIHQNELRRLWLISLALITSVIGMTGGFGYARLRLPIEPLAIILSLTFFIKKTRKGTS